MACPTHRHRGTKIQTPLAWLRAKAPHATCLACSPLSSAQLHQDKTTKKSITSFSLRWECGWFTIFTALSVHDCKIWERQIHFSEQAIFWRCACPASAPVGSGWCVCETCGCQADSLGRRSHHTAFLMILDFSQRRLSSEPWGPCPWTSLNSAPFW